ncbi:hypothetical protein L1887_50653 [Cichorium endivia]|nr:hypothetical protein L1887_50653 [Cichorium endivia]
MRKTPRRRRGVKPSRRPFGRLLQRVGQGCQGALPPRPSVDALIFSMIRTDILADAKPTISSPAMLTLALSSSAVGSHTTSPRDYVDFSLYILRQLVSVAAFELPHPPNTDVWYCSSLYRRGIGMPDGR